MLDVSKIKSASALSINDALDGFGTKLNFYSIFLEDTKIMINNKSIVENFETLNKPISTQIIESGTEELNYRVVKLANNEYGYVCVEKNTLLPFRYDFATSFNREGLAMVAKEGCITWINEEFYYLNGSGTWLEDVNPLSAYADFSGYQTVDNFNRWGLSRLVSDEETRFLDRCHDVIKFKRYGGHEIKSYFAGELDNFKDNGFSVSPCDQAIIVPEGYYVLPIDIAQMILIKGPNITVNKKVTEYVKKLVLEKSNL